MEINLRKVIEAKAPGFFKVLPGFLSTAVIRFLESVNRVDEVEAFFKSNAELRNWDFVETALDYLHFQPIVSDEEIKKIPARGKLICVSNHRLGALDGLSLLRTIGKVRRDVMIVVNDILEPLEQMRDMLLFYDLYSSATQKTNIKRIHEALADEKAVIFFPAGTVAKLTSRGVKEAPWYNGPVLFARKYGAPVLPMYVHARSSWMYYLVSMINRNLASLFLSQAMFSKRHQSMKVNIGDVIPKERFEDRKIEPAAQTDFLRKLVLELGQGRGEQI